MTYPDPNSIVAGDTEPLVTTLTDKRGPLDLTDCSVVMRMKSAVPGAGHAPIAGDCAIVQSLDDDRIVNKGKVSYPWADGETDTPGVYGLQWVVTFPNGKTRTFPNSRRLTFNIDPAAA